MADKIDELDLLVDAGLKNYVAQVAPLGMEARVLRRVHAGHRLWRIWIPAAAGFAIVCLGLLYVQSPPVPELPTIAVVVPPAPPFGVTSDSMETKPSPLHRKRPKPEKLTEGERALLNYIAANERNAHQTLQQMVAALDAPKPIEALRIEPLDIPGTDKFERETNQ
ncbi:MAG: hypothetical protein QOJ99_4499 [Bryobacterales bacterium]|jgi:hypothetical protein|nr:hypothetical protein [Bryobacterales bacterium]